MTNANEYTLGQTDNIIHLERIEENRNTALAIAQQTKRTLHIVSYDLDPKIYNTAAFISAVRSIAVGSRRAKISILINDTSTVVTQGHRLIELARQLSSFIEIRKRHPQEQEFNEAYLIGDETALIYRKNGRRYEGFANFNDRGKCRQTLSDFNSAWEKSDPTPELRRLHI